VDGAVVKRISKFRQAAIGASGGRIDFRGALHVESLVRPLVVEGEKCHPCVRYKLLPLCQAAHSLRGIHD
jgi:hypothetical protein